MHADIIEFVKKDENSNITTDERKYYNVKIKICIRIDMKVQTI